MTKLRWEVKELTKRDAAGVTDDSSGDFSSELQQGYELGSLTDGLVAYYPFDGDVKDYALDNDGTDNTSAGYVSGKVGSEAKEFGGGDDYIDTGAKFSVGEMGRLTMSAWIYDSGGGSSDEFNILANYDGGDGTMFRYDYSSGVQLWFGGAEHNLEGSWPQNQWIHVCVTYDGSKIRYYRDGSLINTLNATESTSSSNTTKIGNRGDGNYFANGHIDDIRVYDRVLSTAEIKALYQRTSTQKITDKDRLTAGLLGHWPLNEDTTGTAYDFSGKKLDSTSVTDTSTVPGLGGSKARNFGASSGRIDLPSFSLDNTSGGLSFGAFVKPKFDTTSASGVTLWRWKSGGSNNTGFDWAEHHGGSGDLNFEWSDDGLQYDVPENWQGEWKHLFFVANDQNSVTLKIFVDGQEVASGGVGGNQTVNASSNSYIGVGDGYAFDIADFRIYNRSLTPSEIKTLADMGGIK